MLTAHDIATKRIWIKSDEHFSHNNIVIYSIRPGFKANLKHNYETHNELMIANHNSIVRDHDIVINLGDIAFSERGIMEHAIQLRGKHYYIRGNHDSNKTVAALAEIGWTQIDPFAIRLDQGSVAFSHYPIYQLPPKTVSVHGHVHNNPYNSTPKHINVSVEVTGYFPILLARVLEQAVFALTSNKGNDADKQESHILQMIRDNQIPISEWQDQSTGRRP